MRLALSLLCAAACICALTPFAFATNGTRDIGTTVRQISRGGAFIAVEPDSGALMGNPAALAFLDSAEFAIDARLAHTSLDYTGALNGLGQKENYVVPNISYATPAGDRLAWGAGIFTSINTAYRVNDYDLSVLGAPPGTTDRSSTKVRSVAFTPGIAYKLDDRTAIGAALHYTNGSADFQAYNMLGNTLGYGLRDLQAEGYTIRAGIYHRASEDTTLGAYWGSRSHLDISGGLLEFGQLTDSPGAQIPDTSVEGFAFSGQYGVGISQRLNCEWTALAEYRRLLWSKGGDNVRFVPSVGEPVNLSMNWRDQDVYVLGAEYRPEGDATTWRLGVNYGKSPVPDETLSPMYPAISEWHYTAGWEHELSDGLSLVTGAVYSPEVSRTSAEGNPFNLLLGAGQPYTLAHAAWQLGIGLTWSFGGDEDCADAPGPDCTCERCNPATGCHGDCQDGCRTYSALME